jgi:S-adenosylmethionine hydrolase
MLRAPQPRREGHRLVGQVLYRDPFGNLITNIPAGWQEAVGSAPMLDSPAADVPVRLVATYGEGEPGETLLLAGSSGTLEIAVRNGRASDILALGPGRPVTIRWT